MRGELVPWETLHAYAAGELDAAARARVEAALEAHPENEKRLEKVRAMRGLLADAAPSEPDDLAWKRLQQRVQTKLAEPAPARETRIGVWLPIGIAAAAVIAAVLLIDREHDPIVPAPAPAIDTQVLASGSAPLDVTLKSGTSLHLAPSSEVTVKSPEHPTELVLDIGELDVRSPMRSHEGGPSVTVRTPAYVAAASSKDFSVGYRSDRYFVEARDGEIVVEGKDFETKTIVRAGERRTVQATLESNKPSRVKQILKESVEKAEGTKRREDPPARAPAPNVKESSEGETSVQVVLEEMDPVKRNWLEAALAYYERRDLPRAIELARKVVAEAPNRAEGRMAEVLLCEALIATKRPKEAIETCEARLKRPHTDEEKREIHLLLGTIHHKQLGNCRKAIGHYGQAMVFGGASLLDDRVRMFRAECAIEIGELDLAAADLDSIGQRRNRLPNSEELDRLLGRLREARGWGGK